jgi:PAS domain S-box-containing protein
MTELRRRAEERLGPRQLSQSRLTYELEVQQHELELQNEEIQRLRRELRETRDRYQDLYERAPLGFVTLDAFGRVSESNRRIRDLLATHRGELVGATLASWMSDDDADLFQRNLREVTTERPVALDTHLVRGDGQVIPVRLDLMLADERTYRVAITMRSVVLGLDEALRSLISALGSLHVEVTGSRDALELVSNAIERGQETLARLRAERSLAVSS